MHSFPMLRILSSSRLDNQAGVSSELARRLNVAENEEIAIHVGNISRTFKVYIQSAENESDTLMLHPSVIKIMHLQPGKGYGYLGNLQSIRLGPVVGIMIEILGGRRKPFAGQTFFIKQLLESGNNLGEICFAFSPYGINWTNKTVIGYVFGKHGWYKQRFPIPDVIYPRERAYANSSARLLFRKKLGSMGVKFLNPPFIGKWETHRVINENPKLAVFLPETRLLKSFQQLDQMISKYDAVYLKPIIGSQGRKIIKVIRRKQSRSFQYKYQKNNQLYTGNADNIKQLHTSLRKIMGNRTYIAQKQIQLLETEGHITDVRVLVQKDHFGQWGITGMACRMGRQGSITSNISSGGSGSRLSTVLQLHFNSQQQQEQIEQEIRYVALESARTLEKAMGPAGEMGIDVGIDQWGKIWFIEANMRPARRIFNLIGEPATRLKSVYNPMLYSRYLAGFQEGGMSSGNKR